MASITKQTKAQTWLVLGDLHANWNWYDWISKEAPKHELVIIPGDLLNAFSEKESCVEQILKLLPWFEQYAKSNNPPLVLCSGNHDWNASPLGTSDDAQCLAPEQKAKILPLLKMQHWMDCLKVTGKIIGDGDVEILKLPSGRYIFSSHYDNTLCDIPLEEALREFMRKAAGLRRTEKIPWIAIHHEPPEGVTIAGVSPGGHPLLRECMESYPPNYVFSGHVHTAPIKCGTCAELLGGTICFNAGFTADAKIPAHIIFEPSTKRISWWNGASAKNIIPKTADIY